MRKNGLYLRLSIADGDLGKDNKDESNSIDNQRTLLVNFVQDRDDLSDEYIEYVDDGYSGTNFERPAFKRMIEDAKTGKIDTIIVKDFSRFGRDYIGVGDYLEQVLPILGIRFISLNNNYDSNDYLGKTMGMDMAIHKSSVNRWYCEYSFVYCFGKIFWLSRNFFGNYNCQRVNYGYSFYYGSWSRCIWIW